MTVAPLRLLFSFAYYGKYDLDEIIERDLPVVPELFADSGAYTAHSQGADITVDDYAEWIDRWRHRFVVYANLDVIGSAEGTYANQLRMQEMGFAPAPVFHGGEPWEFLHDYCAHHDYVLLGGMVAQGMPAALRWCAQAFKIGQEHGTRFHGFGQTNLTIIKSFPWYSVDSSSWGRSHRYGIINLWNPDRAKWILLSVGDHDAVYRQARLIRDHHGDPAVLARPRCGLMRDGFTIEQVREERRMISGMSVIGWRRLEAWLTDWHAQSTRVYLGGKTSGAQLGGSPWQRVYLAEGTWYNFAEALGAAARMTQEAPA